MYLTVQYCGVKNEKEKSVRARSEGTYRFLTRCPHSIDTGEIHGRVNSVPKVVGSPAGAGRLGWRQREWGLTLIIPVPFYLVQLNRSRKHERGRWEYQGPASLPLPSQPEIKVNICMPQHQNIFVTSKVCFPSTPFVTFLSVTKTCLRQSLPYFQFQFQAKVLSFSCDQLI